MEQVFDLFCPKLAPRFRRPRQGFLSMMSRELFLCFDPSIRICNIILVLIGQRHRSGRFQIFSRQIKIVGNYSNQLLIFITRLGNRNMQPFLVQSKTIWSQISQNTLLIHIQNLFFYVRCKLQLAYFNHLLAQRKHFLNFSIPGATLIHRTTIIPYSRGSMCS